MLIQEKHFNKTVAIGGRLKAGGLYDPLNLPGCSGFVANMLTKGTENRTREEIAEDIESVGASLNLWGNTETVNIDGRLLSKDFDRILDVLNDILRRPKFPQAEIEKHCHHIFSCFKAWEDDTDYVADR